MYKNSREKELELSKMDWLYRIIL